MSQAAESGVLVLGDSHAECFFQQGKATKISGQNISIYGEAMLAATVTGFGRSRSALNVNTRVRKLIDQHHQQSRHILFALGQVDVELGLYYRWVMKDEMIEPQALFENIIELYISNIKELSGNLNPIIKGINQTVLKKQPHAFYYTSRILFEKSGNPARMAALKAKLLEVYPSYDVRLFISNMFNNMLSEAAEKAGIAYFDINDAIVNKETGEVEDAFCPNFSDPHIVNSVGAHKLHIKHLMSAIGRSSPNDQKTL